MTRPLRVITAVLLMLIGTGLASTEAAAMPMAAAGVYTYDAPSIPAAPTNSYGDRGPPRVVRSHAGQTAIDRGSGATSMPSHPAVTHTETTYDRPERLLALPPNAAVGMTTTTGDAQASNGDPSSPLLAIVAANAGAHALPKALSGGAADTYVYFGSRNGKNVYTGITNNVGRRTSQHGDRFDGLRQITDAPVTRGQARSIEQALIVRDPGFQNVRNSISPNHAYYDDAVSWGESWLKQNGFG
jgi:hypothetical protein